MADNSRTNSQVLFHILGFGTVCKACKSFLAKCYPDKKSFFFNKKSNNKSKPKSNHQQDAKITRYKSQPSKKRDSDDAQHDAKPSPKTGPTRLSRNASLGPSPLSRSASHNTLAPATKASLLRTMSHKNTSSTALPRSLSRSASRTGPAPILYSNSNGLVKPPPMERQLHCTLDELCFGCVKKINFTKDSITEDGTIVEKDELLTIKVKPGWRKGTKITFENMGDEILPGTEPADLVFVVSEKEHPLFRRQEDDLELRMDIPLVDALTGPTVSVPLLGGQMASLTIDDVVHPGYYKILRGQGMPKQNSPETRGNLIIRFSVVFPKELTEEQRFDAANILNQIS
ncbi:hypothetical protein ABFX02_03G099500 [Erythranthe guttata]